MSSDVEQLQQAVLASNDPQEVAIISDPFTEITVYPTAFLQQYHIYRVLYHTPYKLVLLYLGFAPDLPLYWLVANPQAFCEMAKADEVEIVTPGFAVNYASVFLEVTRNMSVLFYLVTSVDEIKFYPHPTPEEAQARDALEEKYRWVITPPVAEWTEDGYIVTAYIVRQQELARHRLRISIKGDVKSDITVLERDMPVAIGV